MAPFRVIQDGTGQKVEIPINCGDEHWRSFCLGGASVFQCEMYAVFRAAIWLQAFHTRQGLNGYDVHIYSDSQAVVHTLRSYETKSELVAKAVSALNKTVLMTKARITVFWVKGHAGHDGNTEADRLANKQTD